MSLYQKWAEIRSNYNAGKFGNDPMSVADILEASGNKNLFRNATVEELNECLEHTTGPMRLMIIGLIKNKQKIN